MHSLCQHKIDPKGADTKIIRVVWRLKVFLMAAVLIGAAHNGHAQSKLSAYLELAGSAGLYSLNADYVLLDLDPVRVGGRLGIGIFKEGYEGSGMDMYMPVSAIALYAFEAHNIEIGIGCNMISYSIRSVVDIEDSGFERKTELLGNYVVGYRYQKAEGGLIFRVSYTPFFYKDEPFGRYENWGGISVGYAFKSNKTSAASY
jgi:hypothetical protein